MKLKAASGYACYVSDLDATNAFYEKLGLEIKPLTADRSVAYLNWYRIDFVVRDSESPVTVQEEAQANDKGAGIFLYFSVDSVDETYKEMVELGLKPESEPKDMSWGNREFILRDPDGYKIVIFKRKVAKNPTD